MEPNYEGLHERATDLLAQERGDDLRALLAEQHPEDLARLLSAQPVAAREDIWAHIADPLKGEVISELDERVRTPLLVALPTDALVATLQTLQEDDFADILQELPERTHDILEALNQDRRARIESVLYFDKDTAGGLMDLDIITVRANVRINAVRRYLRKMQQLPKSTDQLFITDREGHYQGTLRLESVLIHPPETLVAEVMDIGEETRSLDGTTPIQTVIQHFMRLDLITAPVVDQRQVLLGRITVDDVLDCLDEEKDAALLKQGGVAPEDMFGSSFKNSFNRATWLGVNLATALLAAWVISLFGATIEQQVALAILMPIVASMGGIAGSQTLTLMVRNLALGQATLSNGLWILAKELRIGLLNGALWALLIATITQWWFGSWFLSGIIASAIFINLIFAATSGVLIPLIMHRLNIDPAIAGSVVLTTVTDVIGFAAFLGLASLFML